MAERLHRGIAGDLDLHCAAEATAGVRGIGHRESPSSVAVPIAQRAPQVEATRQGTSCRAYRFTSFAVDGTIERKARSATISTAPETSIDRTISQRRYDHFCSEE
jgi:hypothetical protein